MVSYVFNIIKKKNGDKRKKLLFLGATFKENCNDMRNSKNLEVIKKFIKTKKYNIDFYDPFLQNNKYNRYFGKHFKKLKNLKKNYFAVIILVPHTQIIRRQNFFLNKINDGGYLFDLKGIIDKKNIKKEFNYWSL